MAGGEIDRLEIKVASEVGRASKNLDTLVTKLNTLNGALLNVNGSGLNGLANGVNKLGVAMKNMQSVKTSDFTKLARNIQKLSTINAQQLYTTASAMNTIANSVRNISGISEGAQSVTDFAKAMAKFGSKSTQSAITNLPLLAKGMNDLMRDLSKAPMVSDNLIRMTTALAQLSSQGNKVGTAGRSLSTILNGYNLQAKKSTASTKGLASAIGLLYAKFWIVIRAVKALGSAISESMNFLETVNYFEVAVRNIGQNSASEWKNNGYVDAESYVDSFSSRMKDLTAKMTGFTTDTGGNLSRTGMSNLGLDINTIMQNQAVFAQMADSMGLVGESAINTSKALTMLSVDWSSLRNVEFSESFNKFQSGLAGQSRAVRAFGLDITQANLQEIAFTYGITKNVSEMTQSEKAYLRVIALLKQSKVAYGDLANTIESPANQIRIFKQNMSNLARAIGNIFLPIVAKVLPYINAFAMALQRLFTWIGSLLGVDFSSFNSSMGGISDEVADLVDATDSETGALNDAAKAAGKLNKQLRAWDELNNLSSDSGSSTDTGATTGTGVSGTLDTALADALAEYESKWNEAFDRMDNKAARFAENIATFFTNMYNAAEPFRKAVINLWDNGLSKLASFSFTALKDFYENLLVPLGKWAFGTEDKGLTRLVNIINDSLMKIDWDTINKNLKDFWIAIEPYAESFGEGLIDFFKDASNLAVGVVNAIFGKNGALTWLTSALNNGDPESARQWGYSLGVLATGLFAINTAAKAITGLQVLATFFEKLGNIKVPTFIIDIFPNVVAAIGIIGVLNATTQSMSRQMGEAWDDLDFSGKVKATLETSLKGWQQFRLDSIQELKALGVGIQLWWQDTWLSGVVFNFGQFFATYVLPWFTVEKWTSLFNNIMLSFNAWWIGFSTTWTLNVTTWWNTSVMPWFTYAKWSAMFGNITTSLGDTWTKTVTQWKTNINNWWNKYVEPWFTVEKWTELGTNMQTGMYNGFRGIVGSVIGVLNKLLDGVENLVNMAIEGLNSLIEKADSLPGVDISFRISPINFGTIPTPAFKTGGFPEDGLFYANSQELVGKFSNGRTAVANNAQITSGIAEGVAGANESVVNAIVSMTNNIVSAVLSGSVVEIDGQAVFNTVKTQADNYSKMYNEPAFS